MSYVELEKNNNIGILRISRGKVNAINEKVVSDLKENLELLENDEEITALILTGNKKFFSFGFDIPEFLSSKQEEFQDYLIRFTDLYKYLFQYPKAVIAALNGHTIAGGCMLALACDYRIMVEGKPKISLNEISFGSSVFAGSTEILRFWVGNTNATKILYSGDMYSAVEAKDLGLVQEVTTEKDLMVKAKKIAIEFGSKNPLAFASIKSLLRKPILEYISEYERTSIHEFVDIWYSEKTWNNLQKIKIF